MFTKVVMKLWEVEMNMYKRRWNTQLSVCYEDETFVKMLFHYDSCLLTEFFGRATVFYVRKDVVSEVHDE